jgi:hypothetical protein
MQSENHESLATFKRSRENIMPFSSMAAKKWLQILTQNVMKMEHTFCKYLERREWKRGKNE